MKIGIRNFRCCIRLGHTSHVFLDFSNFYFYVRLGARKITMNVICFAIVSLFFVRGASAGSSENATLVNRSTPDLGEDSSVIRRKWISEVMAEVEMTFNMHINVSSECRRDFEIYRLHAKNQTVWAIRMMESTEWPKIGLFSGVTTHLGNYAECLRSRGPGITGQYCLAQATYDFTVSSIDQLVPGWTDWPEENASAWKVIKMHEKNPLRRSRRSLTWAMCIPSSCTAADLQTSLSNVLRPAFKAQHFDIATHVKPAFCTVEEALHRQKFLDPKRFPAMFMLLVVGTSTIYTWIFGRNQVTEKDRLSVKLVKCFSAVQNYKALYQSSSRTYPFLHFLKIVFMFFIIGAHAVIFYSMFPNYETEQLEVAYRPWAFELHWTAFLNAFFMVSGFLRAFHFDFSPESDNSVKFFLRSLVLKWLRMVPVNGLGIAWFYFVMPYLEDGPISNYIKQTELQHCASNWWINMLALQNIVNHREMCHPHTWYIATDIQLYLIGTVLLIIFRKHKKCGIYLMIVTFLYSALHTFVKTYWNTFYRPFAEYFMLDILHYPETFSMVFSIHTATFYRMGPYLIGYVTALVTKSLVEKGYKFSRMQSILLPFFLSVLALGIQLNRLTVLIVGRQRQPMKEALFGTLQPTLFVLPIASLICVYFVSGFGVLHEFFDHKLYVPLGKLSYSVYLVSSGVQSYHIFNQRRGLSRFNKTEMYWWMMGDIAVILPCALGFYMVSGGPVNNITNLFIKPFLNKYLSGRRSEITEKKRNIENSESNPTAVENLEVKKASFTLVTDFVRERKTRINGTANTTSEKHKNTSVKFIK